MSGTASESGASPDFGRVASDYNRYRGGFPEGFFERLASHYREPLRGRRVLDLGCGTGALANEMARRGCVVTGIDPSEEMLAHAADAATRQEVGVTFLSRTAEQTGLPDGSFDLVMAGRCWHWFDRPRAAAEVRRILRRQGMLVICHFDRVSAGDDVVSATRALVEKMNPRWAGSPAQVFGHGVGLYGVWLTDLAGAGFEQIETFSFDARVSYSHEEWRGRVRSSGGVGAELSVAQMDRLDAEVGVLLAERFTGGAVVATHRLFAVVARAP